MKKHGTMCGYPEEACSCPTLKQHTKVPKRFVRFKLINDYSISGDVRTYSIKEAVEKHCVNQYEYTETISYVANLTDLLVERGLLTPQDVEKLLPGYKLI